MHTQGVRDAPRRHAEVCTRESVGTAKIRRVRGHQLIVVVGHSHKHSGLRASKGPRIEARMFHCLPRCFEQNTMLRIDRDGLTLVDAEKVRIEAANVIQEGPPLGRRLAGHAGLGVVVLTQVPARRGHLSNEVLTAQQRLPELFGRLDPTRKPAPQPDNCNWGHRRVFHLATSSSRTTICLLVEPETTSSRTRQG